LYTGELVLCIDRNTDEEKVDSALNGKNMHQFRTNILVNLQNVENEKLKEQTIVAITIHPSGVER